MTNETERPVITEIDEDAVYVGTLHFYSKGSDDNVTIGFDFSHILDDNWDKPLPAAYDELRKVVWGLRRSASTYSVTPEDVAYLSDPNISDEDKARRTLEITSAQDEASDATIN